MRSNRFISLFDSILKFKGYPLAEAMSTISSFSNLSRAAQLNLIEKKKSSIVDFHSKRNEHYRSLLSSCSDLSWEKLPIIRKQDLQGELSQMLTQGYRSSNVYVSNTSGSSGHPFFFAKDKFTHALTWAYIQIQYEKHNLSQEDWQARFYGIPLDPISKIKETLKDLVLHRVRFPVFDLSEKALEGFLRRFKGQKKIHYVYGYTNSILLFADFLHRRGVQLVEVNPNLKCCIVTSEVCRDEDKAKIQQAFGIPVFREYGASELDIIAFENPEGRWNINEANLYVEVLSEDNKVLPRGQSGKLVITSLHNKAMPFIRYDLGDIGVLEEDDIGLKLSSLAGRINDTILLPSGKKSPGLTFYYVSRSILESSGILKEFIIRQTSLSSFEFDVVCNRPLTIEEQKGIRNKMDIYLEPGLSLKINRVEKIERPDSGKIKHFYSELYEGDKTMKISD